ncbi:MAG: flagellar hook-basal body complex protein, partial [Desulfobacteraceae bacterium]
QGAIASVDGAGDQEPIVLDWDGSNWTVGGGGELNTSVIAGGSDETQVQLGIWDDTIGSSSEGSVIQYTFGSSLDTTTAAIDSIEFEIDPSPPQEYPDAVVTPGENPAGNPSDGIGIDFNDDTITDIYFDTDSGGTPGNGNTFSFDTNPNVPPAEYSDATLRGDQTEAIIDLDGSGNESDNEDIRFTFTDPLKFGGSTHPYNDRSEIDFDIIGSTSWSPIDKSEITQSGYFSFTTDFLGGDFGSTENEIELDIGTVYDGINFVNDSMSTTQFAKASSTVFQDADGYAAGDLQSVDIASDGVITGVYSNGELIPLFRVGLAKFLNNYGLSNEGGNLFSETRDSGTAITNKPGENGLGTLSPNSLEMSNADISEEFVNMITTQRGFQANSKTVTTTDEMMQTVINMKR